MGHQINRISNTITEIRCDQIPACLTNSYIINTTKANYLVDSGLGSRTALEMSRFINSTKPIYLINTHYHWDHIWGNAYFDNTIIVCHERCRDNIERHWNGMIESRGQFIDGEIETFEVSITFDSRMTLNDELELIFTPGHTDDSISIFHKAERVLFVGDLIGDDDSELVPSVMDPGNFLTSLDTCIAMNPEMLVSGHNDIKRPGILECIKELYLGEATQ